MEYKILKSGYISKSQCSDCIHNYINNGEGIGGCRAFPNDIPHYVKLPGSHNEVIHGQEGDFVFAKAKFEELSPVGQYFWKIRHR